MASQPGPGPGTMKLAYVRPVQPLFFREQEPDHEHLAQSPRHRDLVADLHQLLRALVGPSHAVASDMFLYWNASNPRDCRAPDAAIKLGLTQAKLVEQPCWKIWELGVPELVVELVSLSDTLEPWSMNEKREAYERIGVSEFVVFDLDQPEGKRLQVWDRVDGDFVQRIVEGERTPCVTLSNVLASPIEWLVAPLHTYPAALRLADAGLLVPTDHERALAAETERLAAEQRADAAEVVAAEATARIAELEAALAAARGERH